MADEIRVRRLSHRRQTAAGASILLGAALAGYGVAGSYETISTLAALKGVPLPGLVPVGIDGGLVGVVVLDLAFTWTGQPLGWLRQLARLLTTGTVVANAAAGWPDPLAIGLHAAAPLMLLAMVESGRAVLLRLQGQECGTARDRIPLARWLLSPWRTWLLWRRMVLWQITSYPAAVDIEAEVGYALALLRSHYGRRWARKAPAELTWMLRNRATVDQACSRVLAMVQDSGRASSSDDDVRRSAETRQPPATSSGSDAADGLVTAGVDPARFLAAMRLNRRHWAAKGRPVSAETVRKQLGIGAAGARMLTRAVREADRVAAWDQRP